MKRKIRKKVCSNIKRFREILKQIGENHSHFNDERRKWSNKNGHIQ
jgi:hypothetical protein